VDPGEVEIVDEFWRVVGRDRTERKRALEVESSGKMMGVYVTVMPQIAGDAVYSGSDLFSIVVYINELS